jgi:hypothetical protein
MKRFPMLDTLVQLVIILTVGLLEKLLIFLYCLLPIGVFMLLMSFRSKNHKATAIGTFTNERSEFQHIFPNYILVIVEPAILKKDIYNKLNSLNSFLRKYAALLIFCLLILLGLLATYYYFYKY